MRTRPLAAWDACLVHAQANHAQTPPRLELGLIVPKKAYPLAVDRNRIRRVLRAQCFLLAQALPCTVQLLFRIKTAKKGEKKNALAFNPHNLEFSAAVKQGLEKTLTALNAQTAANTSTTP
jgi:RNase P protein component